jgi:hypothetical protein
VDGGFSGECALVVQLVADGFRRESRFPVRLLYLTEYEDYEQEEGRSYKEDGPDSASLD